MCILLNLRLKLRKCMTIWEKEGKGEGECHSTTAKPQVNTYKQKKHPNTQNKLKLLHAIQVLPSHVQVDYHLSYLYTGPYYIRITLLN